jgi:hypothetical protein
MLLSHVPHLTFATPICKAAIWLSHMWKPYWCHIRATCKTHMPQAIWLPYWSFIIFTCVQTTLYAYDSHMTLKVTCLTLLAYGYYMIQKLSLKFDAQMIPTNIHYSGRATCIDFINCVTCAQFVTGGILMYIYIYTLCKHANIVNSTISEFSRVHRHTQICIGRRSGLNLRLLRWRASNISSTPRELHDSTDCQQHVDCSDK